MKELILLVGPMGSGKSTYCKENLQDYYYVNQDSQGKHAHMVNFKNALETHDKIVVDRCNFPRNQRKNFLEPAKEAGFTTKILVMNYRYKKCYDRLMAREEHPTLTNQNEDNILHALTMYFNKYDYVRDLEADEVVRLTDYDPFLLDITRVTKGKRVIAIGDAHGCFDEVQALLRKLEYKPKKDVLIFSGDLNDRGPKIRQMINFVRNNMGGMVYSIMGNHDNKFLRYLRGNKVNTFGLRHTIAQVCSTSFEDKKLRIWMESLPYAIKFRDDKYMVHGGINPSRPVEGQRRDTLLYARTYNPDTGSVTDKLSKPWFDFDPPDKDTTIYFGHAIYDKYHMSNWAKSLDGGAYKGKELRAGVFHANGYEEVVSIKSKYTFKGEEEDTDYHESLEPYELRVQAGYLRKSEERGLVLYKYTDQCTFEKKWDEYTRAARGIIFKKLTGECVARPFPKFFNIGEMPETFLKDLPDEEYECFDKLDGSLGIMYWRHGRIFMATAGSLMSDQAIEATRMLNEYNLDYFDQDNQFTLLFEIIYPENKIVCDYGDERKLVLLGGYWLKGVEMNRGEILAISQETGFPVAEKYDYTIEQMLELQKTLPYDKEGFVVRFKSGLRVKIKGEDYLRIHRAISGATPLGIWRHLDGGRLPKDYMEGIPEEVIVTVETLEEELHRQYRLVLSDIKEDIDNLTFNVVPWGDDKRKELGLYLKSNAKKLKHPSAMFPYLNDNSDGVEKYIMKKIRPTGNDLHETISKG